MAPRSGGTVAPRRGLDFRILGPLEVGDRGSPVAISGAKQRALLALLLLHANEVVPVGRLIDELWGEEPTETAAKSLQVYVSRLRKTLRATNGGDRADAPDEVLVTRPRGYMLRVEPGELDLERFERLLAEGEAALRDNEIARAESLLSQALSMWRGPPLAGVDFGSVARSEVGRLEELRLRAQEQRIEAELSLGRHSEAIGELEALIAEHPLRERLRGQLMLALYRCGRQAEALEAYRDLRRTMVEELGLEPGSALQELEQAILRHDPALDAQAEVSDVATTPPSAPSAAPAPRRRRWIALVAVAGVAVAGAIVVAVSGGGGGPTVAPNAVAVIDAKTNRVVDQVPVGADPTDVSPAGRSVWVANTGDDTVSKVDERTRRVGATIAPGTAVDGMAAGEGAVWTSDNQRALAARIDPALRRVDRSIRVGSPDAYHPLAAPVATGAGSVWVVKGFTTVARIDPARRRVEAQVGVGNEPSGIAVGAGGVWVADDLDNTVTRIDPKTNGVIATIPVGRGASGIAAGESGVWVAETLDDAVARIDPETNSVTTTIPVGVAPTGVAVGAGAVWVANGGDGTVSRIEPRTDRASATIDVGQSPQALAVAGDALWVSVQAIPPSAQGSVAGGENGTARMVLSEGVGYSTGGSSTDPAIAIPSSITYATGALLLNYPDRPFPAGARLRPEVARAMPDVSDGGKTYTYRLRPGFRFSPPSDQPVTAAAFKRAIERTLDPRTQSYAENIVDDIAGLRAYQAGRTRHIAGVVADGNALTIRLTAPSPTLPARLATPWFSAVPPNSPVGRGGVEGIASAGPYYVASANANGAIVLKRNPNYGGDRPAGLSAIDVAPAGSQPQGQGVADVEAGRTDAFALNPDEGGLARLRARYGPQSDDARAGQQRFFSQPSLSLGFMLLNTQRPLFSSARIRRAVNYAIDREALARRPLPESSGKPTDQYLPPGMRGYSDAPIYPLGGPDVAKAKRLAGGRGGRAVMWTCNGPVCKRNAEIVRANLKAIGIDVEIRQFSDEKLFVDKLPRPGGSWDIVDSRWYADYADPFETISFLFDPTVKKTIDFGGFDDPRFEAEMRAAARLSGPRRYRAYGRLDAELARRDPPVAAYANESNDYLFSARMGCEIDQPVYGIDLAALCVRPSE
jgi:YVTN family beta-propeller protein